MVSDAPGRDVLLEGRQTLETTQPAMPVALMTAGVITDRNTERSATVPASPGALLQPTDSSIWPPIPSQNFLARRFTCRADAQIGVGVTDRPGDGSRDGARLGRSTRQSRTPIQTGQRSDANVRSGPEMEAVAESIRRLASRPVIGERGFREKFDAISGLLRTFHCSGLQLKTTDCVR